MKTKNSPEETAQLVLEMYEYALTNDLDISNLDDVKHILQALGQEKVSDERVEQLMTALAVTNHRIRQDVAKRKKQVN